MVALERRLNDDLKLNSKEGNTCTKSKNQVLNQEDSSLENTTGSQFVTPQKARPNLKKTQSVKHTFRTPLFQIKTKPRYSSLKKKSKIIQTKNKNYVLVKNGNVKKNIKNEGKEFKNTLARIRKEEGKRKKEKEENKNKNKNEIKTQKEIRKAKKEVKDTKTGDWKVKKNEKQKPKTKNMPNLQPTEGKRKMIRTKKEKDNKKKKKKKGKGKEKKKNNKENYDFHDEKNEFADDSDDCEENTIDYVGYDPNEFFQNVFVSNQKPKKTNSTKKKKNKNVYKNLTDLF
ncbi:hypothetical protein M0813_12685 [Anaeramoeba flamelloides]|uniref:Uncharacterized protein n=1 Tax=Anaeramoeba flamelloides TaxID=1746091 RepID=A0ABQ8ZBR1_9EUKA|nr:hypothetical protein M0813_12685 [Anaeramoeba flamelloides]